MNLLDAFRKALESVVRIGKASLDADYAYGLWLLEYKPQFERRLENACNEVNIVTVKYGLLSAERESYSEKLDRQSEAFAAFSTSYSTLKEAVDGQGDRQERSGNTQVSTLRPLINSFVTEIYHAEQATHDLLDNAIYEASNLRAAASFDRLDNPAMIRDFDTATYVLYRLHYHPRKLKRHMRKLGLNPSPLG